MQSDDFALQCILAEEWDLNYSPEKKHKSESDLADELDREWQAFLIINNQHKKNNYGKND
jgi:HKD family nuclease